MNRCIENARRYICCLPCSNNTISIMVVDTPDAVEEQSQGAIMVENIKLYGIL